MFEKWFESKKKRRDAVSKAREGFVSWLEISKSVGWKIYEEKINKEMENIKDRFTNDTSLDAGDLKDLQLEYQVWKKVKRIPKEIEQNAKGGK